MASSAAVAYFRPRAYTESGSGAVAYVPIRAFSGLFAANLSASNSRMDWRPHAGVPIGYVGGDRSKPVIIDESWLRHWRFVDNKKLGGAPFPTLPEVANFVTQQQIDAQFQAAIDQFTTALAQSVAQMQEVVKTAGLAGSAQLPPVPVARQETNPTP